MNDLPPSASYVPLNRAPKKKTYKKPEAKVASAIDDYLALLGCIVMRTNAGHWETVEGHHIHGVPEGYADLHACTPHGCFLAIETKALGKQLKPKQRAYQALVEAHGATYIKADSFDAFRAGLCAAYEPQRVAAWEAAGRARAQAKQDEIAALKKKMGQLR